MPRCKGVQPGPPFGSIGNESGSGIWQFSPLKYILLGNAQPFLRVKECASFCNNMSVVTDPSSYSSACSSTVLYKAFPQKRATSSARLRLQIYYQNIIKKAPVLESNTISWKHCAVEAIGS